MWAFAKRPYKCDTKYYLLLDKFYNKISIFKDFDKVCKF